MSDRFATVEVLARRVDQLAAGDPDATRVVYGIVIALAVVGVLLLVLAIWMIRRTKADPELLGPLERMGESKWRKSDPAARQALLDEVRPAGATPPSPSEPEPAVEPATSDLPPPVIVREAAPEPAPQPVTAPLVEPAPEPERVAVPAVEPEPVPVPAVAVTPVMEPEPEPVLVPVVEPAPERVAVSDEVVVPHVEVHDTPEAIDEPIDPDLDTPDVPTAEANAETGPER